MEVNSALYQVFYRKLCETIGNKELKKHPGKIGKGFGRTLWQNLDREGFQRLFPSDSIKNIEYFYIKNIESNKRPSVTLDERIMLNALIYLRPATDALKEIGQISGVAKKVLYLIEGFKTTHLQEVKELTTDLALRSNNQNLSPAFSTDEAAVVRLEDPFLAVIKLIRTYFEKLSESNYGVAWKLWSPKGRKITWDDNFSEFKKRQLLDINIIDISNFEKESIDRISCALKLQYAVPAYRINTTHFLNYTINETDKFLSDIRLIKGHGEINNDIFLNNLRLYKFFEPTHFAFGYKDTSAFDSYEVSNDMIEFVCRCKFVFETKWVILSIDRLESKNSGLSKKKRDNNDENLFI